VFGSTPARRQEMTRDAAARAASRGPRQVLQRALLRAELIAEREFELVLPRLGCARGDGRGACCDARGRRGGTDVAHGRTEPSQREAECKPVPETTRVSRVEDDAPNRRVYADADRSFPGIPNPEASRASPRRV
jgi:hypothetical protein